MKIFGILGLLFTMVPCLHQCKVYNKRKLRVWRSQKCNSLVSAKTGPTGTGQQTTPCLAVPYLASNRKFQYFGAVYRHGSVFAPMQCLYCKKTTGVESLKMQFPSQCKTDPAVMGQQTTPCLAVPYWANNRNFQNFGATYRHGTVLVPMQSLYCKETTGVESPKMQFPSQCKNRTYRYGSTNYPVSCSAVLGKQ